MGICHHACLDILMYKCMDVTGVLVDETVVRIPVVIPCCARNVVRALQMLSKSFAVRQQL